MPTVIDTLLIKLGLDPTQFTKGQQQAVASYKATMEQALQTSKNIETFSKNSAHFLRLLRNEVVAVGAALVGASSVKDFITNMIATDTAVAHTARTLGMAPKTLASWQAAARVAGADVNALTAGFERLNASIVQSRFTGVPPDWIKWARSLGIQVDIMRDTAETVTEKIFANPMFQNLPYPEKLANLQAIGLGDEFLKIYDRARQMGKSVHDAVLEAGKLAGVTDESILRAEKLNIRWNELSTKAQGVGRELRDWSMPYLEEGLRWLEGEIPKVKKQLEEFWPIEKEEIDALKSLDFSKIFRIEEGSVLDRFIKVIEWLIGHAPTQGTTVGNNITDKLGEFVTNLFGPTTYTAPVGGFKPEVKATFNERFGAFGGGGGGGGAKPAGTSMFGEGLTTVTAGGQTFTVSSAAAPYFKGFVDELAAAGAPINSIGGYNPRHIAGTNIWSEHAHGSAIDIDQLSRDQAPALRAWANAHPQEFRALLQKYGITSGGDWRNPDFGHFERKVRPGETPPLPAAPDIGGLPPSGAGVGVDRSNIDNSRTSNTHSSNETNVNIQTMNIASNDPQQFAKTLKPVLEGQSLAMMANYGLV